MSTQTQVQPAEMDKLLEEAAAYLDELIKTEQQKLSGEVKKAESSKEESSKEKSKEESSKEESSKEKSLAKDDGSHYEDQSPEMSQPEASQEQSQPAPEEAQPEQEESLESLVQGLDDQMLMDLQAAIEQEMHARKPAEQEQAPAIPEPQPSMQPEMHKSEDSKKDESSEKLAKAEKELQETRESLQLMTELVEKIISKPVGKAVTDIRSVEVVDKGDKQLQKSEEVTDADLQKKLRDLSSNGQKLGTLAKSEREAVMDYFSGPNKGKRTETLLRIVNK